MEETDMGSHLTIGSRKARLRGLYGIVASQAAIIALFPRGQAAQSFIEKSRTRGSIRPC